MAHSFSSRTTLLIWKYKDLIKIVWRHKVQKHVCGQEKNNLILEQSETDKNFSVNFN